MTPDFTSYKTRSLYAVEINQGYSARLDGLPRDSNPHAGPKAAAWYHGWDECDAHAAQAG